MKVKSLTIELDVNEIEISMPNDLKKVNIGELMSMANFSIVEQSNDEKLSIIANDLLEGDNIVIGFACFNLKEIIQINNQLQKADVSLHTVYIPSEERIKKRKAEAMENARLHGRWIGSSEEEVVQNFINFRSTLQEIKDGLKNSSIIVKAV